MRSRATTAALVSSSRRRALEISIGCRPLLKVLAKAPLTALSRPFSKLSSSPKDLPLHLSRDYDDVSRPALTCGMSLPNVLLKDDTGMHPADYGVSAL